jgi:hypothetical protein
MSKCFNPSNRKPYELQRFCSSCRSIFSCDGSCGLLKVTEDRGFCFCPQCWVKGFGDNHVKDEARGKCTLLEKYLKVLGKEKLFTELGDDC